LQKRENIDLSDEFVIYFIVPKILFAKDNKKTLKELNVNDHKRILWKGLKNRNNSERVE